MAFGRRSKKQLTPREQGQQDYVDMKAPNPPGEPYEKQFKDYMDGYKNPAEKQKVPGAPVDGHDNQSDAHIVDEIRRLDKLKEEIQAERKELADTLIHRHGFGQSIYGTAAKATTIAPTVTLSLSKEALEREMGKKWVEKRLKPSSRSAQVRCSDYNPNTNPGK